MPTNTETALLAQQMLERLLEDLQPARTSKEETRREAVRQQLRQILEATK